MKHDQRIERYSSKKMWITLELREKIIMKIKQEIREIVKGNENE